MNRHCLEDLAMVYLNLDIPPFNHKLFFSIITTANHNSTNTYLLNHQLHGSKPVITTTTSQWRLPSKLSTTSPRASRVPFLVPARKPTRRLPRTTMSTLALGKPEQIFRKSILACSTLTVCSLTAAKDAVGDKVDESTHNSKAEAHKQLAENN